MLGRAYIKDKEEKFDNQNGLKDGASFFDVLCDRFFDLYVALLSSFRMPTPRHFEQYPIPPQQVEG